jgi:hypothetical protein
MLLISRVEEHTNTPLATAESLDAAKWWISTQLEGSPHWANIVWVSGEEGQISFRGDVHFLITPLKHIS